MRIIRVQDGYKVESQSRPGVFYFIDLEKKTCTCPEFQYRMKPIGGICKHINFVDESVQKKQPTVITKDVKKELQRQKKEKSIIENKREEKKERYKEIISFVATRGEVPSYTLFEQFGEEPVQDLIRLGELIESKGMIRVLD
jgi:hypothetical protein